MFVVKRNGIKQEFSPEKINRAINAAFLATNCQCPENPVQFIQCEDGDSVEEIQNKIENWLMDQCKDAAKAFILYRERHKNIRDFTSKKIKWINKYKISDNTANATIDDNSNVSNHNIAVLNSEIHKEDNKTINLRMWEDKLKELYPEFDSSQMIKDFNSIAYPHDISSQVGMPYCVAITMYPFLLNGIKDLGGLSAAPKNIDSFCGMFINMVFAIASQYKGAVATPGLLNCMDWFIRKEWGDDYYLKESTVISVNSSRVKTIKSQIHQYFQQIVYSLMQPSAARGSQAVFWNISIFDKPFFDTMYSLFMFPDGTAAKWESLNWLQKEFLHWFNQERLKVILTFPVVSLCLIYQDHKFVDQDMYEFACKEYADGNSFFTYISDSADSLSSCCRLSSKIEKPQFNFTNGQLSEMTGSKNVITLNFNRIVQDYFIDFIPSEPLGNIQSRWDNSKKWFKENITEFEKTFRRYIVSILDRIYKYQIVYNSLLLDLYNANLLSTYNAGFINLTKQYLTIGINGLNQAAEFLGIKCNNNEIYKRFCNLVFTTIKKQNQLHKTKDLMFNTEFTPCESAAIKLYNRDKKDGYWVPKDTNLYASYIFKPNDPNISVLDKIYLHGRDFCGDNLDGGSSAHINLEEHLSISQYQQILKYAAEVGCKYFTFNVPNSECEDCGYITKRPINKCPKCGSTNISLWDRVIG